MKKNAALTSIVFIFLSINFLQGKSFLYHGSLTTELKELMPKRSTADSEQPLLFATPDPQIALGYALLRQLEQLSCDHFFGILNQNGTRRILLAIAGDKTVIEASDHGGSLYALPPKNFSTSPFGAPWPELVSTESIRPLREFKIKSLIRGMRALGGTVAFVSPSVITNLKTGKISIKELLLSETNSLYNTRR